MGKFAPNFPILGGQSGIGARHGCPRGRWQSHGIPWALPKTACVHRRAFGHPKGSPWQAKGRNQSRLLCCVCAYFTYALLATLPFSNFFQVHEAKAAELKPAAVDTVQKKQSVLYVIRCALVKEDLMLFLHLCGVLQHSNLNCIKSIACACHLLLNFS